MLLVHVLVFSLVLVVLCQSSTRPFTHFMANITHPTMRRSDRNAHPSQKIKENMDAHRGVVDAFYRAIEAGKNASSPEDRQAAAELIRSRYNLVRMALEVVPPDLRRELDLTLANLESHGALSASSVKSYRTTSSKRAKREAQLAALELDRQRLLQQEGTMVKIRQLQVEEEATAADFAAQTAQIEAEKARQVAEEKKRQLQTRMEIERLKGEVEQDKLRVKIEKKQIALNMQDEDDDLTDSEDEENSIHGTLESLSAPTDPPEKNLQCIHHPEEVLTRHLWQQ